MADEGLAGITVVRRIVRAIQRQACAMPRRPQVHQATGHRYLPHPRTERRLAPEGLESLEHRHHRVLEQVLGERAVSHDAPNESVHRRPQHLVEVGLGALLPAPRSGEDVVGNCDFGKAAHEGFRCRFRPEGRSEPNSAPHGAPGSLYSPAHARVVELVDTADSKSAGRKAMRVRFSPWAPPPWTMAGR